MIKWLSIQLVQAKILQLSYIQFNEVTRCYTTTVQCCGNYKNVRHSYAQCTVDDT